MSANANRSVSRGRDSQHLTSVGRGGAGNFKRSESVSGERLAHGFPGEERGRELFPDHPDRITHSGRGGAGNIRSPSRDVGKVERDIEEERVIIQKHDAAAGVHSSGRGGAGNLHHFSVSPSRPDEEDSKDLRGRSTERSAK